MSGVSPAYELGFFHDQLRAALSQLIGPDSMSGRLRRAGVRLSHFKNPERLPEQLGQRFVKIQEDLTSIEGNVGKGLPSWRFESSLRHNLRSPAASI